MKMIKCFAGIVALTALAACGGGLESKLTSQCATVASDEQIEEEIVRAGISVDDYCACVGKTFAAFPEATLADAQSSMDLLATAMEQEGKDGEAVYKELRTKARADNATAEDKAKSKAFDEFGEQLEAVFESMEENGGQCPA